MLPLEFQEDIRRMRFAFAGAFAGWPGHLLGPGPEEHIQARGGLLVEEPEVADYLVVGSQRKKGRAAALRRGERSYGLHGKPVLLDERGLLALLRPTLAGRSFFVVGGLSSGIDLDGPARLIEAVGGRVATGDDGCPDYAVVGPGREQGKAARLRELESIEARGERARRLDESLFLELLALARPPRKSSFDARDLTVALRTVADPKKVGRAIQMLKQESFQIFAEAKATSVAGVVRSQTDRDTYYACWVGDGGRYACFDSSMSICYGQSRQLCKHSLLLLIGLAVEGAIEPRQAYDLALATLRKKELHDEERSAELLLRFKAAQAGEIDWRPTETVPEDFYAL